MAKVGHIEVEVKPTITLESAAACTVMLNMFLEDNDEYALELHSDGKWHLVDKHLTDEEKEILADMPALRALAQKAGFVTE